MLKWKIQQTLNRIGYEVHKTRAVRSVPASVEKEHVKITPINVFPLVVQDLIDRKSARGEAEDDFFFVQIGAHDGLHYDPVRPFVTKYHWRGILVEPQPAIFERLVENYKDEPQLVFENVAMGLEDGRTILYAFKEGDGLPDHASMLTSFERHALVNNAHDYRAEIVELDVPCLTVASLLSKHNVDKIDLLQIDTEGFDFHIIKMFSLSEVRPTIIHFENAGMNMEQTDECYELFNKLNYRVLPIGIDTVAYRQEDDADFLETFENKGYS